MPVHQLLMIVLLFFPLSVYAQRPIEGKAQPPSNSKITLKCSMKGDDTLATLKIDLANKLLSWGTVSYTITSVTDRYISAYETANGIDVGGSTLVVDRTNGKFIRALVGIMCSGPCDDPHLDTATYMGVCSKGLF